MRDVVASVSVAVMLIPQAMAYATLAGVPAVYGLYAAALAPIAAAPFVSSRYLQTGPVALTSVLTFGALSAIAAPGSGEYIKLAALLALMVGVFRVLLGLLRAGWLAYLMSQPVLKGFMTAAAVLITASQIPTLLGVTTDGVSVLTAAAGALAAPGSWSMSSLVLGAGTLAFLLVAPRLGRRLPAVPMVVLVGLACSWWLGFGGPVIGDLPRGLPIPSLDLPFANLPLLVIPGAVIALVGFAEASAIARHYAAVDRSSWNPDQEFVSQGAANLASGLVGGFPVGGSFSRTSVANRSGGQSRWVGALTGLLVLLFIPVVGVLASLPTAVLGAIVISAVVPLMDFPALFQMRHIAKVQATVAWFTFGATVVLAPRVDLGVVIGVVLALLAHVWRERGVTVSVTVEGDELRLEPIGVLFFMSAPGLDRALLDHLADHPTVTRLVVDLQRLGRIDYTGAVALKEVVKHAKRAGLEVELARVPRHAIKVLSRTLADFSLR